MTFNKAYDEQSLLKKLIKGDQESFNVIFDRYARKLYSYAYVLTRDRIDSEEIVQETFLRVWENRQKINPELSFNAFLIIIARNLIYNKAKRRVLEHAVIDYFHYTYKYYHTDGQDLFEKTDDEEAKNRLIEKLPKKRRQILKLRMQGYSNEEVARILNISKSTVANQINNALKDLQKLFTRLNLPLIFFIGCLLIF